MARKKACFVDYLALILLVVGGINWGVYALNNQQDLLGVIGIGRDIARIIYIVMGAAGVWGLFVTLGRLK